MDEIIHIDRRRLLEIAAKELRLGRTELNHIEDCPDCRGAFAKVILEVTRGRAQEKTRTKKKRRLVTGVHIPDGRFREIVFSLTRAGRVPAVLSAQESEHFHACPACVDRLGDIARQIFKEQPASASAEDGRADTEHATDRYSKHRDETTEGQ